MTRIPGKIWALLLVSLQLIVGIAGGIGAAGHFYENRIIPGVEVSHVSLSGMTYEDAGERLTSSVMPPSEINLTWAEHSYSISLDPEICTVEIRGIMEDLHKISSLSGSNYYFLNTIRWVPLVISFNMPLYVSEDYLLIELAAIKNEIDKDPQDAKIIVQNGVPLMLSEESGWSLDVLQSKMIIDEYLQMGQFVDIPLQVTELQPMITGDTIPVFNYQIASFSIKQEHDNEDEAHNIMLALEAINGRIIEPGSIFSFKREVGALTAENGYLDVSANHDSDFTGGKGDGICQVASVLYQVALRGELEIVQRTGHSRPTTYVPPGQDVNINSELLDLKFANNRGYPILLTSQMDGSLSVSLYGTEPIPDRKVWITSEVVEVLEMRSLEQPDPSLPKGIRQRAQEGEDGYRVDVFRLIDETGMEVVREFLYTEEYRAVNEVVRVGTGAAALEK